MEEQKAEYMDQLREIRSLMERSSRFISLSGLSGVSAGVVALAGTGLAWWYIGHHLQPLAPGFSLASPAAIELRTLIFLAADALFVLVAALGLGIFFTLRKSRRQNLPVWNTTTGLTLVNLLIPLVTGGLVCLFFLYYHFYLLIAPLMLIFYGLGLVNASKYTLREVRWLGISEVCIGLIALLFPGSGLVFWALGFGVLHIIYGWVMYYLYER